MPSPIQNVPFQENRMKKLLLALVVAAAFLTAQRQAWGEERIKTGVSKGGQTIFDGNVNTVSGFERVVPEGATLTAIKVKYGVGIDSVTIVYEDAKGKQAELPRIGGDGGDHSEVIVIGRKEILAGIKVKSGVRVDSIRFIVKNIETKETREVFAGGKGGDNDSDLIPGEETLGIYGDCDGHCLCRVGLVYKKK
jgi:hypothetical protein